MESLSEKYLKLLSEYEKLKNQVSAPAPITNNKVDTGCPKRLKSCSDSYSNLYERKQLLVKEMTKLYQIWLPPRVSSFFSTIIPWIKKGFKVSSSSDHRLEICKKCDLFTERNTCEACGCYMVGKVKIPQARCPIGKWKADPVDKPTVE
tara:strand:+ start:7422 stop:7868 length:447 start_codon:yes stop_codon:yes gene_type:complete